RCGPRPASPHAQPCRLPQGIFQTVLVSYRAPCAPYVLSLHDALPIWRRGHRSALDRDLRRPQGQARGRDHAAREPGLVVDGGHGDRKSTRLNSSHVATSYAVFCLKTKTCSTGLSAAVRAAPTSRTTQA